MYNTLQLLHPASYRHGMLWYRRRCNQWMQGVHKACMAKVTGVPLRQLRTPCDMPQSRVRHAHNQGLANHQASANGPDTACKSLHSTTLVLQVLHWANSFCNLCDAMLPAVCANLAVACREATELLAGNTTWSCTQLSGEMHVTPACILEHKLQSTGPHPPLTTLSCMSVCWYSLLRTLLRGTCCCHTSPHP